MEESASSPVETSASESAPTQTSSVGKGEYKVSAAELAEFGIDLSDDDSSDSFEYGNVSAEPKVVKEQRLAKAKAKVEAKPQETDDADVIVDEAEEDDWLNKALTDDDEQEQAEDETEEEPVIELIRKGEKHAKRLSEVKDLAQKGFDYEVRNRELKAEKQAFEAQKEQISKGYSELQSQYEELKNEKEQIDALVDFIRDNDPDTYGNIERYAGEFKRQYNNPMMTRLVQSLESKIEAKLGGLEKLKEETKYKDLKADYYSQLADIERIHNQKFAKYGIDFDEKAIQREWIESGLPLKKIYGQLYGDKILSLTESKKQLQIKKNATSKAPTMGRMRTAAKPTKDIQKTLKNIPYTRIADMLIKGELR